MLLLKIAEGYDVSIYEQLLRVLFASLLGAVFGFEREMKSKPAGFITFMLVSMGSCLIALLQVNMINTNQQGLATDTGRIISQVVSGIGFLGAGTIIHNKGSVKGITTAALLWVSAAVGLLIGIGGLNNYIIATSATLLFFPLTLVSRKMSRQFVETHKVNRIYVVFDENFEKEFYNIFSINGSIVKKTFFHNKHIKNGISYKEVYIYFTIPKKLKLNDFINDLSSKDYVFNIEDA